MHSNFILLYALPALALHGESELFIFWGGGLCAVCQSLKNMSEIFLCESFGSKIVVSFLIGKKNFLQLILNLGLISAPKRSSVLQKC